MRQSVGRQDCCRSWATQRLSPPKNKERKGRVEALLPSLLSLPSSRVSALEELAVQGRQHGMCHCNARGTHHCYCSAWLSCTGLVGKDSKRDISPQDSFSTNEEHRLDPLQVVRISSFSDEEDFS